MCISGSKSSDGHLRGLSYLAMSIRLSTPQTNGYVVKHGLDFLFSCGFYVFEQCAIFYLLKISVTPNDCNLYKKN